MAKHAVVVQAKDGKWVFGEASMEEKLREAPQGFYATAAEASAEAAKHHDIITNTAPASEIGKRYAASVGKRPPAPNPKDKDIEDLMKGKEDEVQQSTTPAAAAESTPAKVAPTATTTSSEGAAQVTTKTTKGSQGKTATKPANKKASTTTKKPAAGKKASAAKPAGNKKAAAAPKKTDVKKQPTAAKEKKASDNPFREGSMKAKAYDVFRSNGGDREKTIAATVKLGATEATAKSWYAVFNKVKK